MLFISWLREFARSVFFAHLGSAAAEYWNLKPMVLAAILTQRQDWCTAPERPDETCETRLAEALEKALAGLRQSYGPDMAQWRWGQAHAAAFPNRVLDRVPLLGDWLRVAIPNSGGPDTVDVAPISVRDETHPYEQRHGPGLRMITDLADPSGSRMIAVPGQSGNPLSRHYADLVERWRNVEYLVPGRAPAVSRVRLPGPARKW